MIDSGDQSGDTFKSTWDRIRTLSDSFIATLVTYSLSFEQEQDNQATEVLAPFSGYSIDSSLSSVESRASFTSIDLADNDKKTVANTSPSSIAALFDGMDSHRAMDASSLRSIEKRVSNSVALPRTGPITVEIEQSIIGDETDYVINLTTKNRIFWHVSYRFSYFRILRDFVLANVATELDAVFPSVFSLSWIMNMQQAQLQARQQQLWEWITELLSKYSQFSRVAREGISAFFNGCLPDHRIEKYLMPANSEDVDEVCDRCYVSTAIMDIRDHPTYIVIIESVWRQQWEVQYRFNSFRILNSFIVERFPKMVCFEFPRTHTRSSYGMKLPIRELVERHVHLKFWMIDALACFPLFPDEIQEEMCMFFEGHPKYEPLAILRKASNGETVNVMHSELAGKFGMCTNPVAGVDMLLADYGLSDEALESTSGRYASSKLLDIVAFLQLPDNVAFEITRYSAIKSKIIFADQLLKWADVKASETAKHNADHLTEDQETERDEIEASLESFYDFVYRISTLPDDDLDHAEVETKRPLKSTSPGNALYAKTKDYEYCGVQLIAGKIASVFHSLTLVEDTVYCAAYTCLEKIIDSGARLASYSIIGGKKNSAASVRTATCVSLLGEVATIGPHLPFIDNAESVLRKILETEGERFPASLKYVAAVMKQLMESEKIRIGTETSSKQLEKTMTQIEVAEDEYRKVLSRRSPGLPSSQFDEDTVRVGNKAIKKEAIDALFEVLSVEENKSVARRSTMAMTPESVAPLQKKALRRLSADDNMLLRLAHYGSNAEKFTSGESYRSRSESVEQDLISGSTFKPFEASTISKFADSSSVPEPMVSPRRAMKRGSLKDVYHNELQSAFDFLVQDESPDLDTGEKRLSLQKFLNWDQVQSVLSNGDLTADDISAEFEKLATSSFFGGGHNTIEFDSFCILMETLESS